MLEMTKKCVEKVKKEKNRVCLLYTIKTGKV